MFYNEEVLERKYHYNPEKAVSLLKEAGFERNEEGIMVRDGQKLEFEMIIAQGNRERERAATIMQSDFEQAGINLKIRTMEWSAQVEILLSHEDPLDYQAQIVGNLLGPDPDRYHVVYGPSQYPEGVNYMAYLNEEAERLFMEGRTELDPAKRAAIYEDLQRLIVNDAPAIWLWYTESLYAYAPELNVDEAGVTGRVHIHFLHPNRIWMNE
jgi:peptide/nickel transport system substrate-binding protein